MSENQIPFDEFVPPTQKQLEAQARDFYRTCKRKVYRELKKSNELNEICQLKAQVAKRYAEDLISSGEHPGPAWSRAIRLEILESETD